MKTQLLLRASCALLSVIVPMWLIMHMPSDSAFSPAWQHPTFDGWHAMMMVGSLIIMLVTARFFVRS